MKNPLRSLFDAMAPLFESNRFLKPMKPLFEATDNFFFSTATLNRQAPFLRDGVDLKRFMMTVIFALVPPIAGSFVFFGPYVLSMILISYVAGGIVEIAFAIIRKEEISEGFLVSGMLLPLILPVSAPLWVVALGMAFGVLFGKEIFGGTGHNPLNPALVGRCFIFLAWPKHTAPAAWVQPFAWFRDVPWTTWLHPKCYLTPWAWLEQGGQAVADTAINAVTAATPLAHAHSVATGVAGAQLTEWSKLLMGNIPGSVGETSAILIAIGGIYLMWSRVSNFRCTISVLLGAFLTGSLLHAVRPESSVPGWYHLLEGGLLFAAVYMATDPVSGPATNAARWVYGFLIGVLIVIGRTWGPFPEWTTFAVLLMNLFAPLLDEAVWALRFRRLKQCRIQ